MRPGCCTDFEINDRSGVSRVGWRGIAWCIVLRVVWIPFRGDDWRVRCYFGSAAQMMYFVCATAFVGVLFKTPRGIGTNKY